MRLVANEKSQRDVRKVCIREYFVIIWYVFKFNLVEKTLHDQSTFPRADVEPPLNRHKILVAKTRNSSQIWPSLQGKTLCPSWNFWFHFSHVMAPSLRDQWQSAPPELVQNAWRTKLGPWICRFGWDGKSASFVMLKGLRKIWFDPFALGIYDIHDIIFACKRQKWSLSSLSLHI